MTTPTTGLGLSSIQTEFGGANPISLSEYYRGAGGGYVASGQTTSATDGVAISTSGTIRMGMFRGITKTVVSSFVPGLTGGSTLYTYSDDFGVSQVMTVQTDGTITFTSGQTTARWGSPTTAGAGNSYWVKMTLTANSASGVGTASQTATTAWLQLNFSRSVSSNASATTGKGTKTNNATYTIQIATDAAGSNIVTTGTGYQLRAISIGSA